MVPNVKWVIVSHYGNVNLTYKIFMANRFRSEMTSFVLEDLNTSILNTKCECT